MGPDLPPVLRHIPIEQRVDHFNRFISELVGFNDPLKD